MSGGGRRGGGMCHSINRGAGGTALQGCVSIGSFPSYISLSG